MKKFKFRLQKLLDIKLAKEKEIQHELAAEVSKQNVLIEKQNRYRDKVASERGRFHQLMSQQTGTFNQLNYFQRYSTVAERVIESSQLEIDAMEPAINEIRKRLSEAVKERQKIEKLKERKYEAWKYHIQREEEKEYDEINMKIFTRMREESEYYDQ